MYYQKDIKMKHRLRDWDQPKVYGKYAMKTAEIMISVIDESSLDQMARTSLTNAEYAMFQVWRAKSMNLSRDYELLIDCTLMKMFRSMIRVLVEYADSVDYSPSVERYNGEFVLANTYSFMKYESWWLEHDGFYVVSTSCDVEDFWDKKLSDAEALIFNKVYVFAQDSSGNWLASNAEKAKDVVQFIRELNMSNSDFL